MLGDFMIEYAQFVGEICISLTIDKVETKWGVP